MGVSFGLGDIVRIGATAPFVIGRMAAVTAASRVPGLRGITDNYAVRVLKRRLKTYGSPEFTTDAETYTPTVRAPARAAA